MPKAGSRPGGFAPYFFGGATVCVPVRESECGDSVVLPAGGTGR